MESKTINSPLGSIFLAATPKGITILCFDDSREFWQQKLLLSNKTKQEPLSKAQIKQARKFLRETTALVRRYFRGDFAALKQIKLDTHGTSFQEKVWHGARRLKAGKMTSYGALAKTVNNPHAYQAVGSALRLNPVCLATPCHRVVAVDGKLTGYREGTERKVFLVQHEGAII